MKPDFSGWATKYGVRCSDGRTIVENAFQHHDGARVPLVWKHDDDSPDNILGYGIIHHRKEGVWIDGFFNETPPAIQTKALVQHGDLDSLSIHAVNIREQNRMVTHGTLAEVSVVILGANPEARIDNTTLAHSGIVDSSTAIIHSGERVTLETEGSEEEEISHADEDAEETLGDIINTMNEKQKNAMYTVVALAAEENSDTTDSDEDSTEDDSDDKDDNESVEHSDSDSESITHQEDNVVNVFEGNATNAETEGGTIKHTAASLRTAARSIIEDARRSNLTLKDSYLKHAGTYGLDNIEVLFPDAKASESTPQFLSREMEWVPGVLNSCRKLPFSRVKSMYADITADTARAKGYVTGAEKFDEVFPLFKRATTPTTIYKKQKLDRDDIIDIEDFDVVSWLRQEMRVMLNEEIARAILLGDGRLVTDADKVAEPAATVSEGSGIRSIKNDADLYAIKAPVGGVTGNDLVETILRSKKGYKGSGAPTLYTTVDVHVDMLLAKDGIGRRHYNNDSELALALGVSKIVDVEVMEEYDDVVGILVNLADYAIGTSRGGQLTNFDDFDIDFNQYKYLMETRLSGGLTKVKSAIVFTSEAAPADPEA